MTLARCLRGKTVSFLENSDFAFQANFKLVDQWKLLFALGEHTHSFRPRDTDRHLSRHIHVHKHTLTERERSNSVL